MISLALTVKVLTQDIDKVGQDAEQRKAKLKSLLARPPSSSALPRTNAQQIPSQNKTSSTTQSSVLTTNNHIENKETTSTVGDEKEKVKLIKLTSKSN